MELVQGIVITEPTGGASAAPASDAVTAAATSENRSAVLGYSEDIGALFHAKRDYAKSRLGEFKEFLEQTQSPARNCSDEMMCRFLETNVAVKHREVKGCSCKQAAKDIESTVKWRAANGLDVIPHPLEKAGEL